MREAVGDIWEMAAMRTVPVVCVTTNLQVSRGVAVMGAGIAREARDLFPGLAKKYGEQLQWFKSALYVGPFSSTALWNCHLIMFPTKDDWRNPSIPAMIEKSATDLVGITDYLRFQEVLLPRPGCGMGGLQWTNVKPLLDPILDDRFIAVTQT
jgi:hypothetical protein